MIRKLTSLKAIRRKCLDCCAGQEKEVKLCPQEGQRRETDMKRKMLMLLLTTTLGVPFISTGISMPVQAASVVGTSAKKMNLLSNSQCVVFEPNYNAEDSQSLTPGTTFSKDPYVRSTAHYDAYCFIRVEVPTVKFTLSDKTSVISDAVKMLYNGKEGINVSEWKAVKEIPSNTVGTNSVYIFEYIGNGGILKARSSTDKLFDSMQMPGTVSGSKVSSVEDFTGSVAVQGYVISTASASSVEDAYTQLQDRMETDGEYSSNSSTYDNGQQGVIDTLTKEKLDLQGQVDDLEERLNSKLSTGNAKTNEVIKGKIFSTSYEIGLIGTMPNYDRGLFVANSDGTYSWTDLDGITHTQTKEGYLATYPAEAGIVRNADGTITIKAGYHAEQVLDDANQSYTIRYNGNGGTGSMADQKIANDTGTKLTKNAYARTGYTFTGWNTKANGTGTGYTDQEAISHSGIHDLILYAQWKPITYYVAFHGNGSSYGVMSAQRFTYDEAQPLSENSFEKNGYELSGWSTSQKGSVQYSDMEAVTNLTATDGATINLYAVWAATGNAADNHIDHTSHTHVWVTKYDSQHHWEECAVCGQTRNIQNHSLRETSEIRSSALCSGTNQYWRTCACGYTEEFRKEAHEMNPTWNPTWSCRHIHYQTCRKCGEWQQQENCKDANGNNLSCANPGTCVVCGTVVTASSHRITNGVCGWCGKRFYTIQLKSITYDDNDHVTVVLDGYTQNGFEWTGAINPNWGSNACSCYSDFSSTYRKINANTYEFTTVFNLDHSKARITWLNYADDGNCTVNGRQVYEADVPLNAYIQSDLQAPSNISVTQTPQRSNNGWTTAMQFTVSGNDYGGSNNVTVQLLDANSNVVYSGTTLVNNNTFSYTFTPNIEVYGSQKYTVRVTDNCYNATDKTITVSNIDSKIPSMTNSINYSGQWAKSRAFTITAADVGAGNVKIGINRVSDMSTGTKNGTNYSKTYCFAGDKYDEEAWIVFLEDAAGNLNQVRINIGKLDNTAPTISASVSGNTATVQYSDYNTKLKREGSGVTQIGICGSKDKSIRWQNASNKTLQLSGSGTYYIYAKDAAGNLSKPYTIFK